MLYGDFQTWLLDEEIERRIFRMWLKSAPDGSTCEHVYMKEIIPIGTNETDYLIGFSPVDTEYEDNMYPVINYHFLSEVDLTYYPGDVEQIYEDWVDMDDED